MQKTRTRLWSVLLTVAMLLTLLPTTALADGEDTEGGTTTGTTQEDPAPETRVENPVAEIKSTGEEFETLAGAIAAAKDGDTVELLTDATVMKRILLDGKNLTIDTNGCSVTYSGDAANTQAIIDLYGNSEVTITGDGAFTIDNNYLEYNGIGYTFRIYGNSRLTIENGTYYAGLTCVQAADNAIAYIEGGDFSASTDWNDVYWLLNLIDNSQAKFVVTGGSFENFDPANSKTENPVANFCAEGYISTSTTDEKNTIYTVVALDEENSVAKVTGSGKTTYFETLPKAVAAAKDGETVTLLKDASGDGVVVPSGSNIVIDFAGYTYDIDGTTVGSTGTETNGFQLLKNSTIEFRNGTLTSSKAKILIQNYSNLTLKDMTLEGGPVTQYIISSNYGDVIAENISIDGSYGPGMVAIDLMHWLNESYKDKAPTLVLRNTDANTISGSIEVYCYGTGAGTCAEKPQLTISGGYFTADPSDYVADGYTVLPSDKSGYDWMVAQEGSNPADVAAGWLHMSNNVDKDASDMESKAAGELLNKMVGSDLINNDLSDYAEILANQNTVTAEQGKAALEAAGISTEGKTVSVYIMPVTRATLDDVVLAEGSTLNALKVNAFTMSFAVKFYTVATTVADGGDILLPEFASADDEVNAVTVGDPQAWPPTWTEITIPLDEIFQIPAGDLYIFDLDNDATYRSSATDRKLTFTAPEGLSTFVIAPTENWNTDTHAVRYVVEDVSYPTEVERVAHGEKITYTPTRAGYAFLGWYTDPELTEAWNMAKDTVTENITLYAKWAAVRPPEGVDKIEVSTGGAVIDEEDAPEGAGEVLDALKGNNGVQQAGTGITDAAENVATSGTVITDEVVEEAKKELNVAEGITITVETYLVVKVTEAADESFTLDITPMYQLKATAEDEEPVDIGEPQKLTVTGSVTLSIPLPSGFADAAENLFVRHMKGGVTYVYEGARSSDGNLLTFTNPHGFSAFTVTTEGYVAKIEDEDFGYTDFQNAVDEVKNGQTITVYASDLSAKVSGDKTFYVEMDEGITVYPNLTAADGYVLVTEETADSRLQVTVYPKRDTSSGSGSSGGTAPVRDITVDSGSHGDVEVSPEEAKPTTTITITVTPDKGYAVAEVVVTAENGKEITVTDKGNGKYTFSMPNSDVTIEVTFQPVSGGAAGSDLTITAPTGWVNPFTDVASNAWYYDAVGYANVNGLMGGTSATTFAPNGAMNRSMVWTVIARLAGQTISGANWAEDAKAWAVAQGVSDGTNPDGNVTREELVTMLYRYIGSPVMNVPELGLINSYPDAASVSDWAQDAFAWALSRGIIDGRDGKLASGESVTRAEAATILARFHLLTK